MAANDFRIHSGAGRALPPTYLVLRDDRDTSSETIVRVGEPLKANAQYGQFAVRLADGDGVVGITQLFWGVAADDSTETASADGRVEVFLPLPGVIYEGASLTATLTDTDSEIDAMRGETDLFDLTSGVYTIDTAATAATTNAVFIVGGDSTRSVVWWMFRSDSTQFGRAAV